MSKDKSEKKLTTKAVESVVKKQIPVPSQPNDVIKDGLSPMNPIGAITRAVVDSSKAIARDSLIKEVTKENLHKLASFLNSEKEDAVRVFKELTYTNPEFKINNSNSPFDLISDIVDSVNSAERYGFDEFGDSSQTARLLNFEAAEQINKATPIDDRYTSKAVIPESVKSSIANFALSCDVLIELATAFEKIESSMWKDAGVQSLDSLFSLKIIANKLSPHLYTEKTALAFYVNSPFLIPKMKREVTTGVFTAPSYYPTHRVHGRGLELINSVTGDWVDYNSKVDFPDIKTLPHYKRSYDLQKKLQTDHELKSQYCSSALSIILSRDSHTPHGNSTLDLEHSLGYNHLPFQRGWLAHGVFSPPRIGDSPHSIFSQGPRGIAAGSNDIDDEVVVKEVMHIAMYARGLYRSLLTNHRHSVSAMPHRFNSTTYGSVGAYAKKKDELAIGSLRSNASSISQELSIDSERLIGRTYYSTPNCDSFLLEWGSVLAFYNRSISNWGFGGNQEAPLPASVTSAIAKYTEVLSDLRTAIGGFNDRINEIVMERDFRPFALLESSIALVESVIRACSVFFRANNEIILGVSLSGALLRENIDSVGYESFNRDILVRLGGSSLSNFTRGTFTNTLEGFDVPKVEVAPAAADTTPKKESDSDDKKAE